MISLFSGAINAIGRTLPQQTASCELSGDVAAQLTACVREARSLQLDLLHLHQMGGMAEACPGRSAVYVTELAADQWSLFTSTSAKGSG